MISFEDFLMQEECDKYNMLQECNAIIQQKENIIKEVREILNTQLIETVSEQFNYQCATKIIEQAKQILDKENK